MEPDKKRKQPDSGFNSGDATGEGDPSSSQAAEDDWREHMHSSFRVRSRAIIAEAVHENNSPTQYSIDQAIAIGTHMEKMVYQEAASQSQYVVLVREFQKKVRTQEISKDPCTMPPQLEQNDDQNASMEMMNLLSALKRQKTKATDSVENVLQRHIEATYYFKNLLLIFNMRQSKQQQLAVRLHQLRASIEFSNALDDLTEQLQSLQNLPEMNQLGKAVEINVIDKVYEATVKDYLEEFTMHIKNICKCARGVTVDIGPTSALGDSTSQKSHLDKTKMQQPADLQSDATKNAVIPTQEQPQLQKQQPGTVDNQTDTSFDNDLLAEYKALLNMTTDD